jgi:hypothetical protein
VTLRKGLVERDPGRADYRHDLAASYEDLGRLLQAVGRAPEAAEAFQAAQDARRESK